MCPIFLINKFLGYLDTHLNSLTLSTNMGLMRLIHVIKWGAMVQIKNWYSKSLHPCIIALTLLYKYTDTLNMSCTILNINNQIEMVQKFMFQFFMLYPHKVCVDKGVCCPTCYLFLRSSFVLEWFERIVCRW